MLKERQKLVYMRLYGYGNPILKSLGMLASVFFFVSCGIPNPLPELDISVTTSTTSGEIDLDGIYGTTSGIAGRFSQDNEFSKTLENTRTGFDIVYEFSNSESADSSASASLAHCETKDPDGLDNSEDYLYLQTERSDGDESELYGYMYVTKDDSNDYVFSIEIYDDVSAKDDGEDPVRMNGVLQNFLYDTDGELLIDDDSDFSYLHLYIAYYVYDDRYNSSLGRSDYEHLGFIEF